jgi:hypothetical protein
MKGQSMAPEPGTVTQPWSTKRPQNFVLSAVMIALAIGLVLQGFAYISDGIGGPVPYLMVLGGPTLAIFYTWYFIFRKFDSEEAPTE